MGGRQGKQTDKRLSKRGIELKINEPQSGEEEGSGAVLKVLEALRAHFSRSVFVGSDGILMA